jgi:hypothetical protein
MADIELAGIEPSRFDIQMSTTKLGKGRIPGHSTSLTKIASSHFPNPHFTHGSRDFCRAGFGDKSTTYSEKRGSRPEIFELLGKSALLFRLHGTRFALAIAVVVLNDHNRGEN